MLLSESGPLEWVAGAGLWVVAQCYKTVASHTMSRMTGTFRVCEAERAPPHRKASAHMQVRAATLRIGDATGREATGRASSGAILNSSKYPTHDSSLCGLWGCGVGSQGAPQDLAHTRLLGSARFRRRPRRQGNELLVYLRDCSRLGVWGKNPRDRRCPAAPLPPPHPPHQNGAKAGKNSMRGQASRPTVVLNPCSRG